VAGASAVFVLVAVLLVGLSAGHDFAVFRKSAGANESVSVLQPDATSVRHDAVATAIGHLRPRAYTSHNIAYAALATAIGAALLLARSRRASNSLRRDARLLALPIRRRGPPITLQLFR
jgi:hypothetical protein